MGSMTEFPARFQSLLAAVQMNCDISDARFAQDAPLCIYLLRMRDHYRWVNALDKEAPIDKDKLGHWVSDKESYWQDIEEQEFVPLHIGSRQFDPFDVSGVNACLLPHGLVYGAGLGMGARPHFYLAQLGQCCQHNGHEIVISDREYARDLTALIAMSREGQIAVRKEALKAYVWQKVEEWQWQKQINAMGRALHCYDYQQNPDAAIEQLCDAELNHIVAHEAGEVAIGEQLGEAWEQLLLSLQSLREERLLRAMRDHAVDAEHVLPRLLDTQAEASIHFYFANFEAYRRQLWPELMQSYRHYVDNKNVSVLADALQQKKQHWLAQCQQFAAWFEAGEGEKISLALSLYKD